MRRRVLAWLAEYELLELIDTLREEGVVRSADIGQELRIPSMCRVLLQYDVEAIKAMGRKPRLLSGARKALPC